MEVDFLIDSFTDVWKLVMRLVLAAICGYIIGRERKARSKEAGVRTHAIVCLASALMMIISKYAFTDMPFTGDAGRIAAQIVTGIGFLGAGMIFYRRDILQGLTTAAGVWATAGIGMAIGAGMVIIGLVSVALILFIQIALHVHEYDPRSTKTSICMKADLRVDDVSDIEEFKKIFAISKILKYRAYTQDSLPHIELDFVTREDMSLEKTYELMHEHKYIVSLVIVEE